MTREIIIKTLEEHLPVLATEYGVKRIGLFGSYVQSQADEDSDIDIVVEFEQPIGFRFIEFAEYLEHLLGGRVDVLTPAGIEGIRRTGVAEDTAGSILYV